MANLKALEIEKLSSSFLKASYLVRRFYIKDDELV